MLSLVWGPQFQTHFPTVHPIQIYKAFLTILHDPPNSLGRCTVCPFWWCSGQASLRDSSPRILPTHCQATTGAPAPWAGSSSLPSHFHLKEVRPLEWAQLNLVFQYWLCHVQVVHPWGSQLTSLSLSFLICKMILIVPASLDFPSWLSG